MTLFILAFGKHLSTATVSCKDIFVSLVLKFASTHTHTYHTILILLFQALLVSKKYSRINQQFFYQLHFCRSESLHLAAGNVLSSNNAYWFICELFRWGVDGETELSLRDGLQKPPSDRACQISNPTSGTLSVVFRDCCPSWFPNHHCSLSWLFAMADSDPEEFFDCPDEGDALTSTGFIWFKLINMESYTAPES